MFTGAKDLSTLYLMKMRSPVYTLPAAALDPRSKIWAEVKRLMLLIIAEGTAVQDIVLPRVDEKQIDVFDGIGDDDDDVIQDTNGTVDMNYYYYII